MLDTECSIGNHYPIAKYALERKLHVLVTKPATQLLSHHIDLIERYGSRQVSEVMLVLRQVCTQLLDPERHGFACAGREAHIDVHLERFGLEISPQPPSRLYQHRV